MSENTNSQKKPFLVIYNVHVANRGDPPSYEVNLDSNYYLSYFENYCEEQWIFVYDFETETGTLRGGDPGWERAYTIVDGHAPNNLTLSQDEQLWLFACWTAATTFKQGRERRRAEREKTHTEGC